MTDPSARHPRSGNEKERDRKARQFLEELSWLLESYSAVDIGFLSKALRSGMSKAAVTSAVGGYASTNPNKQFLVGALPRVFMDETLFPTNEDIAQFAESVMELQIPRFSKKSKYEIIGHVVCETDRLDDRKLARLVFALSSLADGDARTKRLVRQRKAEQFGWNAIIQELAHRDG